MVLFSSVFSQHTSVVGTVFDPNGAPLENVVIEATGTNSKMLRTSTDSNGTYKLQLPAGAYSFVFSQPKGFLTTKVVNYSIPEKTLMHLDILLEVDLESPTSIISEFVCDKSGKCEFVSRKGKGTNKPKEIAVSVQSSNKNKSHR